MLHPIFWAHLYLSGRRVVHFTNVLMPTAAQVKERLRRGNKKAAIVTSL